MTLLTSGSREEEKEDNEARVQRTRPLAGFFSNTSEGSHARMPLPRRGGGATAVSSGEPSQTDVRMLTSPRLLLTGSVDL